MVETTPSGDQVPLKISAKQAKRAIREKTNFFLINY